MELVFVRVESRSILEQYLLCLEEPSLAFLLVPRPQEAFPGPCLACKTLLQHLLRGVVLPVTQVHHAEPPPHTRVCFSHISVRIPDDSRKHSENHWSRPWQSSVSCVSQGTYLPSPKNSLSQWLFRKHNSAEPTQICTKIAQGPVC